MSTDLLSLEHPSVLLFCLSFFGILSSSKTIKTSRVEAKIRVSRVTGNRHIFWPYFGSPVVAFFVHFSVFFPGDKLQEKKEEI